MSAWPALGYLIQQTMNDTNILNPTTFGGAVAAMKNGAAVYRQNWAPDFLIFRQVPSTVPADIIPRMTSLPETVKVIARRRNRDLTYRHQFACLSGDNTVEAYVPTIADIEANDWIVLGSEMGAGPEPIVAGETVGTAKPLE
jgi:Protein of unknown function (DUF2829)